MNILLINQPLGNRGDESAHKALIRTLLSRKEDVHIRVLYIDTPETWSLDQFRVEDERVQYLNLHPFMKYSKIGEIVLHQPWRKVFWKIHPFTRNVKSQYDWADVVVCAPGGICMGGFQDWKHLYFLYWAKCCQKPLAYYGRSFGPFPTDDEWERRFKSISYDMLHYFSFLSIRDKKTEKLADEIGIPYVSTVDTAFLETPYVDIPYEVKSMIGKKEYVVFVPNYLLWHYAYKGKFTETELLEFYIRMVQIIWEYNSNINIVMLPQVYGKGGMVDDLPFFRMIGEKLQDERIIIIPDCYNSDIQQSIIKGAKLVIGARYHSVVFAINQNVPFIALSYEHKISGLLEALGKEDCMVDITDVMATEQNKEICLKEVQRLLPLVKADSHAQQKAKSLAQYSMDQFLKSFDNDK